MPYELKLFQINLGKRRAASYDLNLRTRNLDLFIVLAQEQWMVGGKPAGLDGQHKWLHANCEQNSPSRALIYYHRDLEVYPCPQFTGRDVASALWDVGLPGLPQIMLISLYWDQKHSVVPQRFLDCLKSCSEKRIPIHIGGDFNSHQTLWGEEGIHREEITSRVPWLKTISYF